MEDLLSARLNFQPVGKQAIAGGFRPLHDDSHIALVISKRRRDSQRFYLSRLIGCAFVARVEDSLLPITDAATATQKFERAFAQELLCPWASLDRFTDEHGIDEEGMTQAAEHFEVSEQLIISTLVNRGKLERERLAQLA